MVKKLEISGYYVGKGVTIWSVGGFPTHAPLRAIPARLERDDGWAGSKLE